MASDYKILLDRYFLCYKRAPFLSDFKLAFALGTMIALASFLDNFLGILFAVLFNFIVPFCFSGILRTMLGEIVGEKSSNIKEYLKLNGLRNKAYQLYVITITYLQFIPFVILILIGCFIAYQFGTNEVLFKHDIFSFWEICLHFILGGLSSASFLLFLSVLFKDAKFASDFGAFLYIIVSMASLAVMAVEEEKYPYYLVALFPQSALAFGVYAFQNDNRNAFPITIEGIFIMLAIDAVLYLLLYIYLDQVLPDDNGVKKSWLFCFKRKKQSYKSSLEQGLLQQVSNQDTSSAVYHQGYKNKQNLQKTLQIIQLKKRFGNFTAVNGITFPAYEKQILCLLGHNGAGKTTTISMLTGMLEPSEGDILFDGVSLFDDIEESRQKIGLCMQKDIYYKKLTVREHLELIAKLRHIPSHEVQGAVDAAVERLNLGKELNKFGDDLSGGNKRKLCLAMAILGNVKIVFLDEPTSAMDPKNRRVIWQQIKSLRASGLTLMMTTHHLEEADELADRIAILAKGKLLAMGTAEYLKRQFGVGYYLTCIPNRERISTQKFLDIIPSIYKNIKAIIPLAEREEQSGEETLKVLLPFSEQEKFIALFEKLEENPDIKISLEMNSLEDTYVNIGLNEDKYFGKEVQSTSHNLGVQVPNCIKRTPSYSAMGQVSAMFKRKFYVTTRTLREVIMMIIPAVLFLISIGVLKTQDEDNAKMRFFMSFISTGYSLNTATYCAFPVFEREDKVRYVMNTMGLRVIPYWVGTFLFDFLVAMIINLIAFVSYILVRLEIDDTSNLRTPIEFLLLLSCFSFAFLWQAYAYSFKFERALKVIKVYPMLIFMVFYIMTTLITAIMKNSVTDADFLNRMVTYVLYLIGPILLFMNSITPQPLSIPSYVDDVYQYCFFFIGIGTLYLLLTFYYEVKTAKFKVDKNVPFFQATDPPIDPQEIEDEAQRTLNSKNDAVKAIHMKKAFPSNWAVRGVTFGVEKGQVFGLLGPNGAGKSTTFNMLTGLLHRTYGSAEILGTQVTRNNPDLFENVGICPQFNALFPTLTVKEHIQLFCKIKGIPNEDVEDTLNYYLDILALRDHVNKRSQNLSGGNKRKLCVANCLLGNPKVVFLDEPSSGVDPLARRFLWNAIQNTIKISNASVILTTHSINEAESLAHKTGILVNGKFSCIGPTEVLKAKYGSGYRITLLLKKEQKLPFHLMQKLFGSIQEVQEGSSSQQTFKVDPEDFTFSDSFSKLQKIKASNLIQDFSIYNATLEQVFIFFSKFQQHKDDLQEHVEEDNDVKQSPKQNGYNDHSLNSTRDMLGKSMNIDIQD